MIRIALVFILLFFHDITDGLGQSPAYQRIDNIAGEFITNYTQQKITNPEEYRWNPLHVSDYWQFKDFEGKYSYKKVISDTILNNKRYFYVRQQILPDIYERNSDNASYRYDMYNIDSDSTTLELLCDSLNIPIDSSYYSYRYISNPPYSRPPDMMKIIDRFWAYIPLFDDTVMAVTYERWIFPYDWMESMETWADKYGLVDIIPEGTHDFLSAAIIDGVEYGTIVHIEDNQNIINPSDLEMYQNYPNPFNNNTTIVFNLLHKTAYSIEILNILGKIVRTISSDESVIGEQKYTWDGYNQQGQISASGIYFYQIKIPTQTKTGKMLLIR